MLVPLGLGTFFQSMHYQIDELFSYQYNQNNCEFISIKREIPTCLLAAACMIFFGSPTKIFFLNEEAASIFTAHLSVPRVKWHMGGAKVGSLANILQCCGK